MHWTDRRERYRATIAGEACIHPGSVHDAISARIAEELGFEIGMFAGSIASFAVLGAPDLIVLTLTEFAAQAYRITTDAVALIPLHQQALVWGVSDKLDLVQRADNTFMIWHVTKKE